ncbi:Dps family protein [Peredibacter starrii]|uniref:Dps family protein n=1 Tax=Peredibacter starrii TaxID=28202 RepID=A0AAX4HMA3_9BACT|nr:Dps family protein [Peredibacter starrii]WPU64390.1 Dps family protein [Peredibacter starrii]
MANKIEAEFSEPTINIGISEKDRKLVCRGLNKLLADSYLLYLKTQNYHWNVTGKMFRSLHTLFEEQYQELAAAVDEIAERIRALGEFAPGSFSSFARVTSIKEESSIPTAEEMIHNLVVGNEAVVTTAREIISLTDECEDDVTADLLVDRMQIHEKNAWMLRSMIASSKHH